MGGLIRKSGNSNTQLNVLSTTKGQLRTKTNTISQYTLQILLESKANTVSQYILQILLPSQTNTISQYTLQILLTSKTLLKSDLQT